MGDVFKEQLIKRTPSIQNRILRILFIAFAAILTFFAVFAIPQFGILIGFVVCFASYYVLSYFNVEYEYVFTNGELDIDIIYNKSRRKRVFSGSVKTFDLMCHVADNMRIGEFSGAQATLDFSGGVPGDTTYAFLTLHEGKRTKVIIDPNEKILTAIAGVMSRQKLFVKQ